MEPPPSPTFVFDFIRFRPSVGNPFPQEILNQPLIINGDIKWKIEH